MHSSYIIALDFQDTDETTFMSMICTKLRSYKYDGIQNFRMSI